MTTWSSPKPVIRQEVTKARDAGRKEGRQRALLRILSARGVEVSQHHRQRIFSCTDVDILDRWIDRALQSTAIEEILT